MHTFSSNPFPKLPRKYLLGFVLLEVIDVDIAVTEAVSLCLNEYMRDCNSQSASHPVVQRLRESLVALAQDTRLVVCVGLPVLGLLFRQRRGILVPR
jgi:hypothetical protein